MEIIISNIPSNKAPDRIKDFIQEEIRAGKLTNWKIAKIEMQKQLPMKDKEFPGIIYLTDPREYPRLFTILEVEKDAVFDKYVLSITRQWNY